MMTVVCFHSVGTAYCLPVEDARAVRSAVGLISLPAAGPDVAGVIPGDPPISVVSPLGPGGTKILVLEVAGRSFGVLVDAVTGLRRIDETEIRPPPDGQERRLVSGTLDFDGRLVFVADPRVLGERL
jgi:chemotaxis signal transduction protein